MIEATSTARIVMTTVVKPRGSQRWAVTLVEERLAACATLLPRFIDLSLAGKD